MEPTRKPIDKEYLTSSFQDFDSAVLEKKYLQPNDEQLHTHSNKEVLDKLGLSDDGTLLFNGNETGSPTSTTTGKSAYEIAQDNGFQGTESEWLESLKGRDGTNGTDGTDGADGENGTDGKDGKSAYEIAVQNGFEGTEPEWLDSLKGDQIDAYTKEETDTKFVTAPQIWTGPNQFMFGVDANGNYGYYKAGADTVTPFLNSVSDLYHDSIELNATPLVTGGITNIQRFSVSFDKQNSGDKFIPIFEISTAFTGETELDTDLWYRQMIVYFAFSGRSYVYGVVRRLLSLYGDKILIPASVSTDVSFSYYKAFNVSSIFDVPSYLEENNGGFYVETLARSTIKTSPLYAKLDIYATCPVSIITS